MSFKLSELVDVAVLLTRLQRLPQELGDARTAVWTAEMNRRHAAISLDDLQRLAVEGNAENYAACKNTEAREQFKWKLYTDDAGIVGQQDALHKAEDDLSEAKHNLATILDEFSSVRNMIRLLQVVMGQNLAESIDFAKELELIQKDADDIPF